VNPELIFPKELILNEPDPDPNSLSLPFVA
jgi:hypothetical protein